MTKTKMKRKKLQKILDFNTFHSDRACKSDEKSQL